MSNVDPYVQPIPQRVANPDGSPTEEFLQWFIYDNRFNHDLWQALTGGTGDTSSGDASFSPATFALLVSRISEIEEQLADNPFTVDSSGWTVDTAMVTTDMSKA